MAAPDSNDLHLRPFLAEAGGFNKLVEANQTLSATTSPLDDSLAVHLKATVCLSEPGWLIRLNVLLPEI
jgi:nuclear pore complex protein Nup85